MIKKRYINAAWPTSSLLNAVPPPTVLKCRCRSSSPHGPTHAIGVSNEAQVRLDSYAPLLAAHGGLRGSTRHRHAAQKRSKRPWVPQVTLAKYPGGWLISCFTSTP